MGTYENCSATMDNSGYCYSQLTFSRGRSDIEETKMQFYKNIAIKYVISKMSSGQILGKSDFSDEEISLLKKYADGSITYNELLNNKLSLDTDKYVTNGIIDLNSTFYNTNFLTSYITGDKSYNYDQIKFQGNGFYLISLKRLELKRLTDITNYNSAFANRGILIQLLLLNLLKKLNQNTEKI